MVGQRAIRPATGSTRSKRSAGRPAFRLTRSGSGSRASGKFLQPRRTPGGQRRYDGKAVEAVRLIQSLVYEQGMTLAGAPAGSWNSARGSRTRFSRRRWRSSSPRSRNWSAKGSFPPLTNPRVDENRHVMGQGGPCLAQTLFPMEDQMGELKSAQLITGRFDEEVETRRHRTKTAPDEDLRDVKQFSSDKILKHLDRVNDWIQGAILHRSRLNWI